MGRVGGWGKGHLLFLFYLNDKTDAQNQGAGYTEVRTPRPALTQLLRVRWAGKCSPWKLFLEQRPEQVREGPVSIWAGAGQAEGTVGPKAQTLK